MQTQLLINGELVAGDGEKQPVYNPATGEVLLEIAEASAAQVDAAVQPPIAHSLNGDKPRLKRVPSVC